MLNGMKSQAALTTGSLVLAGALVAFAAGWAAAQETESENGATNEVVATVDGLDITEEDVRLAEEDLGNALGALPESERQDYLVTFLIDLKLISAHAAEGGMAESEAFRARLEYLRDKALMETYLRDQIETEVTDEAVENFYREQVAGTETQEELRARHILVESEEEAQEILSELEGGADFAELATERSQDPAGEADGGDLGYFTRDQLVPEFAELAFSTEVGEIAGPVETQFGWHVLRVEDRRDREPPALGDVEERVRAYLIRRAQADLINRLRGEAEIAKTGAPEGGAGGDLPVEEVPEFEPGAAPDAPAEPEAEPAPAE